MTSRFASLTEQDIEKIVEDETRTHKTQKGQRRWQRSCLLITWKIKNWENLRKRKSNGTNFEQILCRSEEERIRSMYNKTIIRFGFVISRIVKLPTLTMIILDITKTSSNNCLVIEYISHATASTDDMTSIYNRRLSKCGTKSPGIMLTLLDAI